MNENFLFQNKNPGYKTRTGLILSVNIAALTRPLQTLLCKVAKAGSFLTDCATALCFKIDRLLKKGYLFSGEESVYLWAGDCRR
jgi:hypothetical protein